MGGQAAMNDGRPPMSDTTLRARTDKSILISYSRKDRDAVRQLYAELEALGFKLWRDLHDIPGGEPFWEEIKQGIDGCETVVLCMSPDALASPYVQQEWHYARQQGRRVLPVVVADVDFDAVPRWMSRIDWKDFRAGKPERETIWAAFITTLNTPYQGRKVPFMAGSKPEYFVERPAEYEALLKALVDGNGAVAITAAIKGAGGFGKTTLALALCHDNRVRGAFDDGILWVTLGEKPSEADLIGKVLDWVYELTGQRPAVEGREAARTELAKAIGDRYLLLVIDDLWRKIDSELFLTGAPHSAVLITTRYDQQLPDGTRFRQRVDAMQPAEAVKLLSWMPSPHAHLSRSQPLPPGEGDGRAQTHQAGLKRLAERLGEWAVLLRLANGVLRKRLERGDTLDKALEYADKALSRKGLKAFDGDNPQQRGEAVSSTLGVSLELLNATQQAQFARLALFPEDVAVPFTTLEHLWRLDDFDTEEAAGALNDAALLLNFDLSQRVIRLHDVVRQYLRDEHQGLMAAWQGELVERWGLPSPHMPSPLAPLPPGEGKDSRESTQGRGGTGGGETEYTLPDEYAWRYYAYHLVEAGQGERLRGLLLDHRWLMAKLAATDVNALIDDCTYLQNDVVFRLIRSALMMSRHVLLEDKDALAHQLVGRLMTWRKTQPAIRALTEAIVATVPGLYPANLDSEYPVLNQASGNLLATLSGHTGGVLRALELRDGRLLSWSYDKTLRLWGSDGTAQGVLAGHTDRVNGAIELRDGRLLSWGGGFKSQDQSLRLWGSDGTVQGVLAGHTGRLSRAIELRDGRLLSWSDDGTLQLWDSDGMAQGVLRGHVADVYGVLELRDGRLLSWSYDKTLRLWQSDGAALGVLAGHLAAVNGALELRDGRLLSRADDNTLRLWASDGTALGVIVKDKDYTMRVLELRDGRLLSWSLDKTLRLWGTDGASQGILAGHMGSVGGVVELGDGRLLSWSRDKTLRLWASDGTELMVLSGHTGIVIGAVELRDGRILSWSDDKTLRYWGSDGVLQGTLVGHTDAVWRAMELKDGRLLSWVGTIKGTDNKLRLWGTDGTTPTVLVGHTGEVTGVVELKVGGLLSWAGNMKDDDYGPRLWGADGTARTVLTGHSGNVWGAIELSDGRLLSWSWDKALRLWASDGAAKAILAGHTANVNGAIELRNGRLLSWSEDRTLCLWSTDGNALATLVGHTHIVLGAVELKDGRLLSWSQDATLRLWASDGTPLHRLDEGYYEGNKRRIFDWAAEHGLDGATLYPDVPAPRGPWWVAVVRKSIELYESRHGALLTCFHADAHITTKPVVSADGQTIVAGDASGRVLFLRWYGGEAEQNKDGSYGHAHQ